MLFSDVEFVGEKSKNKKNEVQQNHENLGMLVWRRRLSTRKSNQKNDETAQWLMGSITSKLFTKKKHKVISHGSLKQAIVETQKNWKKNVQADLRKSPCFKSLNNCKHAWNNDRVTTTCEGRAETGRKPWFFTQAGKVARCFLHDFFGFIHDEHIVEMYIMYLYTTAMQFYKNYIPSPDTCFLHWAWDPLLSEVFVPRKLGTTSPDAGGCSCKWVVHHTTFIQLYNFGMQSNTSLKIENQKNNRKTHRNQTVKHFSPPLFFVAIGWHFILWQLGTT